MSRRLVLTAYAKPSEKEMLESLSRTLGKSNSEVIIEAIRQLHEREIPK